MARVAALLAFVLSACAPSGPSDATRAPLEDAPELVATSAATQGPPGSDAAPRRSVAFRMPGGSLRPVDREAIALVPRWREGAALIDPERRLYEVLPNGMRRMLAAGASGSMAVSADRELLVYVVARDVLGELRVHDGARERTLASGLASIGVLRITGARVLFVGARPGGIAGVWMAALDGSGARCLTNCDLVTGTDWRSRFVPPPSSADSFEIKSGMIVWRDPDGARREVSIEEAP